MPGAVRKAVRLVAKGKKDLARHEAHSHCAGFSPRIAVMVAGTKVQHGDAARVERTCALERNADVDWIARFFARFQIKEINFSIHRGINDFYKPRFAFRGVVHVHDFFCGFRPLHKDRLAGPAAARPRAGIAAAFPFSEAAARSIPDGLEFLSRYVSGRAVIWVLPVIAAAEGYYAGKLCILRAASKVDLVCLCGRILLRQSSSISE